MSIKNRVFGTPVPKPLQQKIEVRQAYAKTATPGESIDMGSLPNKMNFNGVAELSSRTPFARLWTGVTISENIPGQLKSSTEQIEQWWKDRKENLIDGEDAVKKKEWKNKYLKDMGDGTFQEYDWKPLTDNFQRVYFSILSF